MKNDDVHERICAVDDPACWFKAAYGCLFQPNPFLFTLWIIGLAGKAALMVPKPKKGHAGGCPVCRAWKIAEYVWYLSGAWFKFFDIFTVCS